MAKLLSRRQDIVQSQKVFFWYRRRGNQTYDVNSPFVLSEDQIRQRCANCMLPLQSEKKLCCVECKAAYYCDRECQIAHWKDGHKKDCVKKLKKRLKEAGIL